MPSLSLSELAARLGRPLRGVDAGDLVVTGISTLEEATAEQISFVASPKFAARAKESAAAALLTGPGVDIPGKPTLAFDNVWDGVLAALAIFHPPSRPAAGVHPSAVVDPTARLGEGVSVGPHAVIEARVEIGVRTVIGPGVCIGAGAVIGADCRLMARAVVMHGCRLGDRVILQPGAVIGADGFKYEFMRGQHVKIPQVGIVVLEDDVEVGANTCIDRASFTETRIGRGTKIDNLVQIAHNCRVGPLSILVAQVGLSGSVKIGAGAILAGQVGVANDLTLGDGVKVGAQAGVHRDAPAGATLLGSPAIDARDCMRIFAAWNRLPEALEELRRLRQRVEEMEGPDRP